MGLLKSVNNVSGIKFHEYRDQLYFKNYKYKLQLRLGGNPHKAPRKNKAGTPPNRIDRLREWYIPRKINGTAACHKVNSHIAVFSNDLQDLLSIAVLSQSPVLPQVTEAIVHPVAGVKLFVRQPRYKFRTYLRDTRAPVEVQNGLVTFLKNNPDVIPSRTLHRRLDPKSGWPGRTVTYFSAAYYMDYDEEAKLSYMALMFGEIVGKHYKLEKRP